MEQKIIKLQEARMRAKEQGFTLVELAIVLVIIGLIIGGVLVGQDLIKAAEVRATISQIEQYNAAVNTFRSRFNGLPGDIRNMTSFFNATEFPNLRNGNGNRQLEVATTALTDGLVAADGSAEYGPISDETGGAIPMDGEVLQFWAQLSAAELVGGSYNGTAYDAGVDNSGMMGFTFPASKMDRNSIGVFADGGKNYYQIGVLDGRALYQVDPSLTPEESFNIDTKVDDGRPGSGSVVLRGSQNEDDINAAIGADDHDFGNATPVTTACIQEAVADLTDQAELRGTSYALGNTNVACSIRFRMN